MSVRPILLCSDRDLLHCPIDELLTDSGLTILLINDFFAKQLICFRDKM